jgi:nicotinate-nucleotide adenylyltransferase
MKRIAFYGGSFDPVHDGHLQIAKTLTELFELDEFWFIPAFHAPHKRSKNITSPFCRYAMLALATNNEPKIKISTVELNAPEKPYTFETLAKLKTNLTGARIFFVMGADSWDEITTWREWETVLTVVDIIVVTRPGYPVEFSRVSEEIRQRIVDLRNGVSAFEFRVSNSQSKTENLNFETKIYISDAVNIDVSATEIRRKIRAREGDWHKFVPRAVAKYIEKYEIYN